MKKITGSLISIALLSYTGVSFAGYWGEPFDGMGDMTIKDCKNIDLSTYTQIHGAYGKDKNGIYYGCDKVSVKDPSTFEVIKDNTNSEWDYSKSSYYAKDKYNIYLKGKKQYNVDVNTFQFIEGPMIVVDKNNLICSGQRYEWVKGDKIKSSYKGLDSRYITDGKKVFLLGDGLCQEIIGVDATTWKMLYPTETIYSVDKNGVYYGTTKITGADPKTFVLLDNLGSYGKDYKNIYFNGLKLEGADVKTFEIVKGIHPLLNNNYTKDKNNVWWVGTSLNGADPKTFELIYNSFEFSDYTKDKNNVYNQYKKIDGADPKTFQVIGESYSKDKNNVYFNGKVIKGADSNSVFKVLLGLGSYLGDKNNIYLNGDIIKGADSKTFQGLYGSNYQIDKNNAYFDGKIIVGANAKNFSSVSGGEGWLYATDYKSIYYYGNKIEGADAKTFYAWPSSEYAKDKSSVYFNGEKIEGSDGLSFELIYKDKNGIYQDGKLVK